MFTIHEIICQNESCKKLDIRGSPCDARIHVNIDKRSNTICKGHYRVSGFDIGCTVQTARIHWNCKVQMIAHKVYM